MARSKWKDRPWCFDCAKVSFRSAADGKRMIRYLREHYGARTRTPRRTYECPHGRGWHLTSRKDWLTSGRKRSARDAGSNGGPVAQPDSPGLGASAGGDSPDGGDSSGPDGGVC